MSAPVTVEELDRHYAEPTPLSKLKVLSRLDQHCRAFIALSPFCVISSADTEGRADVSPRGDAPGFVGVLDDATLLVPDRLGNNRVDTMRNIAVNPEVGLLFLVPGVTESLRVNGRARVTMEPEILAPFIAQGKVPKAGILVAVREAFLHCGKALIRSRLWDPATRIERARLPTLGQMLAEQIGNVSAAEADDRIDDAYRNRLY